MSLTILWFCLALIVMVVEINILSFYLIAAALGFIAGGATSALGYSLEMQLTVVGIVMIVASCAAFFIRKKVKHKDDPELANMDAGQRVVITANDIDSLGTALVNYRGAQWPAYKKDVMLCPGIYTIARIDGTRLELDQKIGEAPDTTASK